jgi:hypothetical protein
MTLTAPVFPDPLYRTTGAFHPHSISIESEFDQQAVSESTFSITSGRSRLHCKDSLARGLSVPAGSKRRLRTLKSEGFPSEHQLQAELHDPGGRSSGDSPEIRIIDVRDRRIEVHMVERIEGLGSEL